MSLSSSQPDSQATPRDYDDDLPGGSVSALAVVGLGLGICSLTAVLNYVLWCLPPLAILINVLALRRINHYWPGLVGRPIARAGLALAIVAGVAAPADYLARQWLLSVESRRIADLFFQLLRDNKPDLAFQLTAERTDDLPFGGTLWARYRASGERMDSIRQFVAEPVVRALLELGPNATVRYYKAEDHRQADNQDVLVRLYAVTYKDDLGKPRTFFARLILIRKRNVDGDYAWWVRAAGPIRPEAWGSSSEKLPAA